MILRKSSYLIQIKSLIIQGCTKMMKFVYAYLITDKLSYFVVQYHK